MNYEHLEWDEFARVLCYSSPKKMIVDLYYLKGLSGLQIAEKLGIVVDSLYNKMNEYNLPRRPTGGHRTPKESRPERMKKINKLISEMEIYDEDIRPTDLES